MAVEDDTTVPAKPPASRAGSRIGRYEVGDLIAAGGMGVVYRAYDPELKRDVAIKLVTPRSRTREGLLAEAKTMARLSHPALMSIFDVGATDDGVYIVMPLVTGGTLHDWIHAERRTWRQVLALFVKAGRGLAAAHAAGLVHRDFKPKNVLLDGDSVLVADFGLAADTRDAQDAGGTPAYMAPEQSAGGPVDARADQYSFSIALWEGLHGERPQDAETRTRGAIPRRGASSERGRGVPAWLVNAVERGYRADPNDRWPSVSAMLDYIERRRRLPTRVAIVSAVLAVTAVATVAVSGVRSGSSQTCAAPTARVESVWSPATRANLESAMLATKLPFAQDAVGRVVPSIDAYVNDWQSMHIAACRATHVARTQPADMLDRRMHCLDRRLATLTSHLNALLASDRVAVQKSVATITALPPIQDCDEQSLDRIQARPASAERRNYIARLEQELSELQSFGVRGDPPEFLHRAYALVARTRVQEYVPLHIDALSTLADAQGRNDVSPELTLRELAMTAAQAGDDPSASMAWSSLVKALALTHRLEEAKQLLPAARTALARAGERQDLVFHLRLASGTLACEIQDRVPCVRDLEEAIATAPTPFRRINALHNLLAGYLNSGDYAGARPVAERFLALAKEVTGTHHPIYADALEASAIVLQASGEPDDLEKARDRLKQVMEIRVAAFGENHPDNARTLIQLAGNAGHRSAYGEADAAARRALAIGEALGALDVQGEALDILAGAIFMQRGMGEARAMYDRALSILRDVYGSSSWEFASMAARYAHALHLADDCVAAKQVASEAIPILEAAGDPQVVSAINAIALCALQRGAFEEGFAQLERSAAICQTKGTCITGYQETTLTFLGKWLVKTGRDRARGADLLRSARTTFGQMGRAEDAADIDAFLVKHKLQKP